MLQLVCAGTTKLIFITCRMQTTLNVHVILMKHQDDDTTFMVGVSLGWAYDADEASLSSITSPRALSPSAISPKVAVGAALASARRAELDGSPTDSAAGVSLRAWTGYRVAVAKTVADRPWRRGDRTRTQYNLVSLDTKYRERSNKRKII
jgi:hypothetical protein